MAALPPDCCGRGRDLTRAPARRWATQPSWGLDQSRSRRSRAHRGIERRELEVLHLLAAGKANRDADELFVTLIRSRSFNTHHGQAGRTNRTEAANLATLD
jgi:hypothetical protein